jgi:hypothetical protein
MRIEGEIVCNVLVYWDKEATCMELWVLIQREEILKHGNQISCNCLSLVKYARWFKGSEAIAREQYFQEIFGKI